METVSNGKLPAGTKFVIGPDVYRFMPDVLKELEIPIEIRALKLFKGDFRYDRLYATPLPRFL